MNQRDIGKALRSPESIPFLWGVMLALFLFNMATISLLFYQFDYLTDATHGQSWDISFHETRLDLLEANHEYLQNYDPETGSLKIMNLTINDPPPAGTPLNPIIFRMDHKAGP